MKKALNLLFLIALISCSDDDKINPTSTINVEFSNANFADINQNIPLDETGFITNTSIDDEVFYAINIFDYPRNNQIINEWRMEIRIPESLFDFEGTYQLGDYKEKCWIELEKFSYEDDRIRGNRFSSYDLVQTGYFELANETETTFDVHWSNIELHNSYFDITGTSSGSLTVLKNVYFLEDQDGFTRITTD